jgi:hypothetical protein
MLGTDRTGKDADLGLRVAFLVGQYGALADLDRFQDIQDFFMQVDQGDMAAAAVTQPFCI